MSRPTKYDFGRSRRSSGGWFHWLLVFLLLGLLGWIIWDYTRTLPTTTTAKSPPAPKSSTSAPRPNPTPPPTLPPNRTATAIIPSVNTPIPDGGKIPPPRVVISSNLYAIATQSNPPPATGIRFIIHPPDTNSPPPTPPTNSTRSALAPLEAQVALARRGISPGSIDGRIGSQTRAAIRNFQRLENLPVTGELNPATLDRLTLDTPLFTSYTLKSEDLDRLRPLGTNWLSKSQQDRLDYENALELVAEKFQSHPAFIRHLNPTIDWRTVPAGTELKVPNITPPNLRDKAAYLRILLSDRQLEVYNSRSNLIAHFPCSIAQLAEKRPVGELHVTRAAPNPTYLFNPEIFPESEEARQLNRKLTLQPGPNNPVGTVWIGLDRPGYGIHGTPRPEDVGRTESHGCFRLANWNAELLLKLIKVGTPVLVEP